MPVVTRDPILDRVASLHPAVRANRAALAALPLPVRREVEAVEFDIPMTGAWAVENGRRVDPVEARRRAIYGDTSPLPAIIRGEKR